MRRPIIAGNWKMHLLREEAAAFVRQLRGTCETDAVEVVVCPPYTALAAAAAALSGSRIGLGAQDVFWEPQGAFTGEVSPRMLVDAGCRYVIVGHSERRQHFQETDEQINKKLIASLRSGLKPILCVGETLQQRESGQTLEVVGGQLNRALKGITSEELEQIVIAYEPVWAIGTGRNATPEQAQEAHVFIRRWLAKRFDERAAESLRIQYGGSVTAANAASLLQQPDVDGALVGGASLKAESFAAIVKAAVEAKSAVSGKRTP